MPNPNPYTPFESAFVDPALSARLTDPYAPTPPAANAPPADTSLPDLRWDTVKAQRGWDAAAPEERQRIHADYANVILPWLAQRHGEDPAQWTQQFLQDVPTPTDAGDLRRGVVSYWPGTQAAVYGLGALGADLVGADETAGDWALRANALLDRQAQDARPTDTLSGAWQHGEGIAGTLGGLADWAQFNLGQLLPSVIESLAFSAAGAAAGSSAAPGPGTVAGAVGGLFGKKLVRDEVQGQIADLAAKYVAQRVAEGTSETIAKHEGRALMRDRLAQEAMRTLGATGALATAATARGLGESYNAAYATEAEGGPAIDVGRVLAGGAVYGAAETFGDALLADTLLRGVRGEALKDRVAAGFARNAVSEGTTEAVQEGATRFAGQQSLTDTDAWTAYLDSAAAGGLGGGVVGGVGALRARADVPGDAAFREAMTTLAEDRQATPPTAVYRPNLTLPEPILTVSPEGVAMTPGQRDAAMRVDAAQVRERDALGLTPDVNAARRRHPAAIPNADGTVRSAPAVETPAPTAPSLAPANTNPSPAAVSVSAANTPPTPASAAQTSTPRVNEPAVPLDRSALQTVFVETMRKRVPNMTEMERASFVKGADILIDLIERRDGRALVARNLGDAKLNAASRALFTAATGERLPRGRTVSEDAIYRWAGTDRATERAREAEEQAQREAQARAPVETFPAFTGYAEAKQWAAQRARAFGGWQGYRRTEEFRRIVPILQRLAEQQNATYGERRMQALAAAGLAVGDRVETTLRDLVRAAPEPVQGRVFAKAGFPWVRLDGETTVTVNHNGTIKHRREVPWSQVWRKAAKQGAPAADPDSTLVDTATSLLPPQGLGSQTKQQDMHRDRGSENVDALQAATLFESDARSDPGVTAGRGGDREPLAARVAAPDERAASAAGALPATSARTGRSRAGGVHRGESAPNAAPRDRAHLPSSPQPAESIAPAASSAVAKTEQNEAASDLPSAFPDALVRVGRWVAETLRDGGSIEARTLFERANVEIGGSQAAGAYSPRDAYDALEFGVNLAVKSGVFGDMNPAADAEARAAMRRLDAALKRLPTQSKRTREQDEFQQFSTPPTLAFLAARAANLSAADVVLEPSAGTGDLVVMAQAAGATVVANELAPRRAALLRALGVEQVFTENAEHIDRILPEAIRPTVVLMNPPFSATAGRMGAGYRKTAVGAQHVEQALERLQPGGRLVAIVGAGMAADRPAFRAWWDRIQSRYAVRANLGLSGKAYAKYGTTFDNQLLIIDKAGPTTVPILTESFASAEAALATIERLRHDVPPRRTPADDPTAQRPAAEPTRAEDVVRDEGGGERQRPASVATGPSRRGEQRRSRALPDVAAEDRSLAGDRGNPPGTGVSGDDAERRGGRVDRRVSGDDDTAGGATSSGLDAGLTVEAEATASRAHGALTDAIFEQYQPQKLRIAGAQAHPGALVQSAAMAAVEPPTPTYSPNLPRSVVTEGLLSLAQLEAVVYAGQAHSQMLPNGERRGFFIGDGTGVGKGREISGIVLDNLRQGRRRAVWVSEKPGLFADAKRDFGGIGGDPDVLTLQSKIKKSAAIDLDEGVLFTTYATLRQGAVVKGKPKPASAQASKSTAEPSTGAARLEQLVAWLGDTFDGVIVFDEAHNAGNAITMKGKRGKTKPSAQALAVVDLQRRLPNARIVYVSATGATEVANLSYATRLGLWGEGTAFASVESFINAIHSGGLAAMELVSRDMKALGVYIARSLSFDGVTYDRLEHPLTDFQREVYDELARAWQGVLRRIDEALVTTSADANADAKGAAKAQFWGAQQRFFNQVLTAMQMPTVLTRIEADLAAGDAVVLQIVNTYEAAQARALAEVESEDDLDTLDITPRDGLIQYVRNSFPVAQYEEYHDEDSNRRSRPVLDAAGHPVQNKEAVRMREALVTTLEQIRVPESPLDMLLNHFGVDRIAEITGRKRRVVRVPDPKTGDPKTVVQSRGATAPAAEAAEFQANQRDILIFSDAGGTGYSFHADRTAKNQRRRQHYLLQAGWRADKAVQGFGRTHRTNESSQPNYRLVTTDLPAQKRFLSSIARRLDQLGALTKGQRDTANQGLFSAKDNLESIYAQDAVTDFFVSLYRNRVEGLSFNEVVSELGFDGFIDVNGALNQHKLPDVPQFLNRLLSATVAGQGRLFDAFIERLEARVDVAIAAGTLDVGMQTLRAERVTKVEEHILHTDARTGAQTKAVTLELQHKVKLQRFPKRDRYVRNVNSGKVWAVQPMPDRTNRDGVIEAVVQLIGTGSRRIEKASLIETEKFEAIEAEAAEAAWMEENAKRPTTESERRMVLTGTLLPIWDRIKGEVRVVRAQTEDGERLIGRLVDRDQEAETLEAFGVGVEALTPEAIMQAVLQQGEVAVLRNGWKLKRARVSGELRMEVLATDSYLPNIQSEIVRAGGFVERIQWQHRLFLPTDDVDALARLLEHRPFKTLRANDDEGHAIRMRRSVDDAAGLTDSQAAVARIDGVVTGLMRDWKARPIVRVVAAPERLPASVRRSAIEQGAGLEELIAVWHHGEVWLVASHPALQTREGIERAVFHEVWGHHGLALVLGEDLKPALARLARDVGGVAGLMRLAKRYKVDLSDYADGLKAVPAGLRLAILAEELAAHIAERGPPSFLQAIKAWWGAVRDWLRQHGFLRLSRLNDTDLAFLLHRARRAVVKGASGARRLSGVRFQRSTPFYSALLNVVETTRDAPKAGTATQWRQWFDGAQRRGLIRAAERDWLQIDLWLGERERITRDDIADYVRAHQVRIAEEVKGGEAQRLDDAMSRLQAAGFEIDSDADFGIALMRDGESVDLATLTKPQRADLAMIEAGLEADMPLTFGTTTYSGSQLEGGRDYRELLLTLPPQPSSRNPDDPYISSHFPVAKNLLLHVRYNEREDVDGTRMLFMEELQSDWHQDGRKYGYGDDGERVPPAPFARSEEWSLLALKRMVRMAVERNIDRIAWTTGEQQVSRNALDGERAAGMRAFYDRILPAAANRWARAFGSRVTDVQIRPRFRHPAMTVHGLDITPAMRAAVAEGLPLFSRRVPEEVLADVDAVMRQDEDASRLDRVRQWLRDSTPAKLKDASRKTWLGALATNQLTELGSDYDPAITGFSRLLDAMSADRNALLEEGAELAESVRRWAGKHSDEAKRLFDLMHRATLEGVDPAEAYKMLQFRYGGQLHDATRKNIREALKALRDQMLGRGGDNKIDMMEEARRLRGMPKREEARKRVYPTLRAAWAQLSPEAQDFYRQMRNLYRDRSEQVEDALADRIEASEAPDGLKRKLVFSIRQQFESHRLQGVYFPLQRYGEYFLAAERDDEPVFLMLDSLSDLERKEAAFKARGFTIKARGRLRGVQAKDAPSGSFVADVIEQLRKAGVSEKTQDAIYQTYLQALPELSMRKHAIHRKGVAGFDPDALRAFAHTMAHGAHQLARLRYGHLLEQTLVGLRGAQDLRRQSPEADTRAVVAMDAILSELDQRHQWVLNPQDSALTHRLSSIGFVYFLGVTPAAALVNLTQTAILTFPQLAAEYGAGKAMRYLLRSLNESARTAGHAQKVLTRPDEVKAHAALQKAGVLDKTQTHALMGLAEGGLTTYSPKLARAMTLIGGLFHTAEVLNREASGMAAYRLARDAGQGFDAAVRFAADTITATHFNYSNANRARFLQAGPAKVVLMFKQYGLNMLWHLGRLGWKAAKGETPEVKRLAQRNLTGVLLMSGFFSGAMGQTMVPLTIGVIDAIAHAFGDEDDPWDTEAEIRKFFVQFLGEAGAEVAMHGAVNTLTGADIASRVEMSQLLWRDADRELDGRDAYYAMMDNIAGPMFGIAKNFFVGTELVAEGQVYRGVETMLPKAFKDAMKALRYAHEGVTSTRGDLVTDTDAQDEFLQAIGFTPAEVARQYAENRALKDRERHILDRRKALLAAYAMALRVDDREAVLEVRRKIVAFNLAYPERPITGQTIRRSLRGRQAYSERAEHGVAYDAALRRRIAEEEGVGGEGL